MKKSSAVHGRCAVKRHACKRGLCIKDKFCRSDVTCHAQWKCLNRAAAPSPAFWDAISSLANPWWERHEAISYYRRLLQLYLSMDNVGIRLHGTFTVQLLRKSTGAKKKEEKNAKTCCASGQST